MDFLDGCMGSTHTDTHKNTETNTLTHTRFFRASTGFLDGYMVSSSVIWNSMASSVVILVSSEVM
jgi:hypothetical protein